MRLPETNDLALPGDNLGLVVDRSHLPAPTLEDVLALLPGWARELVSPVRDALLEAWRAMTVSAWARYGQVLAALASPRYAEGPWLDMWGGLLRRPRAQGERDGAYRARLLSSPEIVSPNALRPAVLALVAEVTPIVPTLLEPATDAIFCAPADPAACDWAAFVQGTDARLWALYPGGNPRAGAWVVSAQNVAEFWVVLPGGTLDDDTTAFALPPDAADPFDHVSPVPFPGAWTDADLRCAAPPDALADRVIADVESRRAAGVRWMLLIDPLLNGAK